MADGWNDDPQPVFFGFSALTEEEKQELIRRNAEATAMGNLLYPTLPIYTGDTARCVKCGGTKVHSRYVAPLLARSELGEHDGVMRTCKRCDFSWHERALDAEAAE